jgi:hypothetical protein
MEVGREHTPGRGKCGERAPTALHTGSTCKKQHPTLTCKQQHPTLTYVEWPSPAPSRVALAAVPPAGPLVPPRLPSRYLRSTDATDELRGPGERARSMAAPRLLPHVQKVAREEAAAAASLLLLSLPRIMHA